MICATILRHIMYGVARIYSEWVVSRNRLFVGMGCLLRLFVVVVCAETGPNTASQNGTQQSLSDSVAQITYNY